MPSSFKPSPNIIAGSTDFGSSQDDGHKLTGSVTITGSLTVNGVSITGGGGGGGGISWDGSTANGVATFKDADEATVESNLTFDGSTLTVAGDVTSTGNTIFGNAGADRHQITGTFGVSGSLTQGGGSGLSPDFYEGSGQVALSYAGENLDDPDACSQYHFFIDKGADNDLPEINIGTIDGEQRPGDGSSTINIGTSGSSVTINGGEAGTGANPITIGSDYSAVVVGQLTGTYVYIPGNTLGADGPATLEIGDNGDNYNNLGKITIHDGNNATGSAIIWNSSGSEGLILSSSREVTIYPGISASSNISASSFYGSAGNLSASYTAHDTRNPILSKLDATGKINAENLLLYEYELGHSYFYVCSNGSTRSPKLILDHGLPTIRPNARTTLYSSDTLTNDPFYLTRRISNVYYPITIWNNTSDQSQDKVGINLVYPVTASYRFDVSGSTRFQEDVTIGQLSTDLHQVSGTLHVSGGIIQQQYFSASISTPVNATCSLYNVFNYHLTANSEVTASSPVAGTSYLFFFRQDGTGTRTVDFSGFKWPGGTAPTLSTAAGSVDIVSGISDGTYIYADTTKAFS